MECSKYERGIMTISWPGGNAVKKSATVKKSTNEVIAILITTAIVFTAVLVYTFLAGKTAELLPPFLFKGPLKIMLLFFFSLLFGSVATVLILERNDPGRTMAWLLILLLFPVIGIILYLLLGSRLVKRRQSKFKRKMDKRRQYPFICNQETSPLSLPLLLKMSQLLLNTCHCPPTGQNNVQVLNSGKEIFQAMLQAMSAAEHHIHLETYIFRDDQIGNRFLQLMEEKAACGVKVRLIIDGVGSFGLKPSRLKDLKKNGVEVHIFFPVRFTLLRNKINFRNHRKILVVDGRTGFVGGANIGDDYLGLYPEIGNWRDTHLQINGPAVAYLQRIFLQDWLYLTKYKELTDIEKYFPKAKAYGNTVIQIAADGPDTELQSIMQAFCSAIFGATRYIRLTSPYFIPNETILNGLKTAALSGIKVQILLPQNPDHKLVFWAAHSYLQELLTCGVEIYMYKDGFLHAKVMTVDDSLAIVGTANMDQRSFSLNFEVNAVIYDAEVVKRLNADFNADLQKSTLIKLSDFENRSCALQLLEAASRLISPIL